MDELRKKSDKRLAEIEKKVKQVYKEATDDINEKWNAYMDRSKRAVAKEQEALASARKSGDSEAIKAAEDAYKKALTNQTLRSKQYKDMVDATTDRLAHANQIALDYVNEQMPDVYAYNYNGTAREVEREAKKNGIGGISFNMADESTVKKLIKEGDKSLLPKKLDVPADKKWNTKAINAQITQGIVQGESIDKISKRLQNVTDMDKKASVRNARSMMTNAENAGRINSMKDAEEMGLEYEKVWMATHDERTRESHALLDGVSVPVDEKFPNGLMYAGDPSGDPSEYYNCRCSVVRKLVGFKGKHINTPSYEPTYFDDM